MDPTEAEEMKRYQEYTEELYKTSLNDADNHNGENTHLEPDILECEVKWALGSIITNKASGDRKCRQGQSKKRKKIWANLPSESRCKSHKILVN